VLPDGGPKDLCSAVHATLKQAKQMTKDKTEPTDPRQIDLFEEKNAEGEEA